MGSEGLQLLYTGGCIGCHDQLGAGGTVGPDLAGLADRADERVPGMSAADYVRQSIIDPGAYIAPGYETAMPPVRLDGAQVEALVRYLLATG